MRLRIIAPDGSTSEKTVAAAVARLGRDPACEVSFDPAAYPKVSGEHARIDRGEVGLMLTPQSQSNKTLLNDQPVAEPVALKVGDRIRLGYSGPTIEIVSAGEQPPESPRSKGSNASHSVKATTPLPPPEQGYGATVQTNQQHLNFLRGSLAAQRFKIGSGGIIGRDKRAVQFHLDHPHVSRRHAHLKATDNRVVLIDLGSANGTHVNGRPISKPVALEPGDTIDIGPFSLEFDGESLVSRSRSNNIELVGHKLRRVVKDRATGKPLTLLHDINLVIRPREFVCLLGPSGSGKSTLLTMLSGRNPPDQGAVTVNGEDLYANFAALKQDIAVVPQKDVLHDSLAVGSALRFTAELRLPPDTGRDEMESSVSDILDVVGLDKRRGTLIRHLSGGQLKRASLANELMARPSLLFVDEATSGLDEQTDREMMELFRQVADSGKTVVCITHNLANVEATCHLVVVLTEGGQTAFIGTPEEAKSHFGVTRLGDVYRKLSTRSPEEWQIAFKASPFFSRYIRERITVDADIGEERQEDETNDRVRVNPFRQAWVLTRRYVSIWRGDLQALLAMLGQSLLVAVLLGIVFGRLDTIENDLERAQRTVNLLFLLNISCFWFGCNNAAKELVKERVIYSRERAFNLRIDSYYFSKFLVLVVIALIQVGLLFGIVHMWCGPPGGIGWQALALAALAIAGTVLGLLLSALARTEEVAIALVPIAIIPQIILAGVIAPLDSGLGKVLAESAITARWGERALESLLPEGDLSLLHLNRAEYRWQVGMLATHIIVFSGATLFALAWQSRIKKSV